MEKNGPTIPDSPDPSLVPFDGELDAMRQCAIKFDALSNEQRYRVIHWLRNRYQIMSNMY